MESCLDCKYHKIIRDPHPVDSFNYDDVAIICTEKENESIDLTSSYMSDRQKFKCITVSCRPHQTKQESNKPSWCPLPFILRKGVLTDILTEDINI
jgi:hypothetical protein